MVFVPASAFGGTFVVRTSARYVRWDPESECSLYWLPVFQGGSACLLVHPLRDFDPNYLPSELHNQMPMLTFMRTSDQLVGPVG